MLTDALSNADNRLCSSCAELGNSLGATSFASLACRYLDLLNDRQPRLLVMAGVETKHEDILRQIREALPDWHVVAHDQDDCAFADVGLVLIRASAPFREAEAQVVSQSWRRCFAWDALITHTVGVDDDDLDDVSGFVRAAFVRLTDGRRRLSSVWTDLGTYLGGVSSRQHGTRLRSVLTLGELRNAAAELQGKSEMLLEELTQAEKRIVQESEQTQREFQRTKEVLSSLLRSLQRDLSGIQGRFGLDLTDEINKARQDVLSYVDGAPIAGLGNELEHLVVARAESALQTVMGKLAEDIDTVTTSATDTLLAVRRDAGCGFAEIGAEAPLNVLPAAPFEAIQQESPDGSLAAKLRNGLPSLSVGALLTHMVNPIVGVISGLTMLGLFNGDLRGRQLQAIRKERAGAVAKYFNECNTRCQSELRRSLIRLVEEIIGNAELVCRETTAAIWGSDGVTAETDEIEAIRARCGELRNGHDKLTRTIDLIDQEVARQDMMRQMEDMVGGE